MTIHIENLDFSFGKKTGSKVTILDGFSLEIPSGSIVSLVGPSGCGKSTILRLVGGLVQPDKGSISINGRDPTKIQKSGGFGVVFQNPALLPWRSVEDNVKLPLDVLDRSSSESSIHDVLKNVGLESWEKMHPHELSGGMQQRVALARAIVAKPKFLLLDEPFSHLDEILRFELLFFVQRFAKENDATVLLVTHDVSEAVIASNTVYVLPNKPIAKAEKVNVDLPYPRSLESADRGKFHEIVATVRSKLVRRDKQSLKSENSFT